MTQHWGVDSTDVVDDSTAASVQSFSGGNAVFWARYFVYPAYAVMGNPGQEAASMRGHGVHWLVATISPPPSYETSGFAQGQADGQAFCDAMAAAIGSSTGIYLPTLRHDSYGNAICRVYLDVEYGTDITQDYWNGFASAVANYYFGGQYPFFPCCYWDPYSPYASNTCYRIGGNSGSYTCHGTWSNRPEAGTSTCNYCYSPGPSGGPYWAPINCDSVVGGTKLWQYAENGVCPSYGACGTPGYPSNVDLDSSVPVTDDDETYYMLYVP